METNTLERTENRIDTNNPKELVNIYNDFINKLEEKVKTTKYNSEPIYTLTGELSELRPLQLNESGIRNIKRFKRYLKHAMYGGSVNSINKLLHLAHKRILKMDKYPKLVSVKHDKIQKLKADWKKQQLLADQMLAEYKKEKGDFYKSTFKF